MSSQIQVMSIDPWCACFQIYLFMKSQKQSSKIYSIKQKFNRSPKFELTNLEDSKMNSLFSELAGKSYFSGFLIYSSMKTLTEFLNTYLMIPKSCRSPRSEDLKMNSLFRELAHKLYFSGFLIYFIMETLTEFLNTYLMIPKSCRSPRLEDLKMNSLFRELAHKLCFSGFLIYFIMDGNIQFLNIHITTLNSYRSHLNEICECCYSLAHY